MTGPSRALILCYHRVANPNPDPWGLCVTPAHFAEQLAVLRAEWRPVSLIALCEALTAGRLDDRSVVVTLDDGYADNLTAASPLLERHHVPATVFVVTGATTRPSSFWWDHLERVLLTAGRLPERLRVEIAGHTYEWDLGTAAHYTQHDVDAFRGWRPWQEPPTMRHAAYYAIWERLQKAAAGERLDVLSRLDEMAEPADLRHTAPALLSAAELARLGASPGIDIGAHTITHPTLAALPVAEQREEIVGSRTTLARQLSLPIRTFAYPYGAASNFTEDTVAVVRQAGFTGACTTRAAAVTSDSALLELPRFQAEDWTGAEFSRRLTQWWEDDATR